jgi:hypothetical protein
MNLFEITCKTCGSKKTSIEGHDNYDGREEYCGTTYEVLCNSCGESEDIESDQVGAI